MSSREVVALSYTLFSARDSVSDLIAYGRVSGRAVFDRRTAGRSSVKQTLIGIFLFGRRREGRGVVKDKLG